MTETRQWRLLWAREPGITWGDQLPMRLTCDSCSALYTIEDGLVGTRDFRVSCKSCGKPIFVKSARQVSTLAATHRVNLPGGALPRPSILASFAARADQRVQVTAAARSMPDTESWFVSLDGGQRGPYDVRQMAAMFEAGSLDWATEVWREGLKGWRPARRDPLLVTSVAGARGPVNDTTRLEAARSFLAPEDTVVEPFGHVKARKRSARAALKEVADATEKHALESRPSPAKAEPLPDLRPSERPQAWHSPENTAFREALGLPTDSSQQASELAAPPPVAATAATVPVDAGPTLADAFASATRLLEEQRADFQRGPRPSGVLDLLPPAIQERIKVFFEDHINSHYLVAISSFAAGVLVTAFLMGRPDEAPAVAQEAASSAVVAPPKPEPQKTSAPPKPSSPAQQPSMAKAALLPVATAQASAPSSVADSAPIVRELPTVEDLRREVRKVASDVRRCVGEPSVGVDVDIYLTGFTGGVREVHVRTKSVPPGRAACIIQAVHQMQVPPFTRNELKLMHKFSW